MKIGLIGTIGEGHVTSSGQEIRTKILLDSLYGYYGEDSIFFLDTSVAKKSKFKAVISLIKCIISCRDIILIVSRNGLHTFLPILSFCQRFLKIRIYNNIIGGNIVELIEENPKYVKYMKSFTVNWVQMKSLASALVARNIVNVDVLPNSKPIRPVSSIKDYLNDGVLNFCTFSRISKAKGIELAINTITNINKEHGSVVATLDIFGVPDEDYKDEFEKIMNQSSKDIQYKGVVPFDKSPEVLSKYFMLLFPTVFYGEGFPGTIIDAYASGLPVLASDWKFNPELIIDGVTGLLYDHSSEEDFKNKLLYAISNEKVICSLRHNCLKESLKYTPENVMPIIFKKIDSYRGKAYE